MTRTPGLLDEEPMHQDFAMEFPYRHSTGETIGRSVVLDVLRGTERIAVSLTPAERKRAA